MRSAIFAFIFLTTACQSTRALSATECAQELARLEEVVRIASVKARAAEDHAKNNPTDEAALESAEQAFQAESETLADAAADSADMNCEE